MKRLLLLAFVACRSTSIDAPARTETVLSKDAGPAPTEDAAATLPSTSQPPLTAKERCEDDMPEQSCVPGCEAVPHDCALGCATTCGTCIDACAGDDACQVRCWKSNEHCRTADCGKEAADCQLQAVAAKKRNYGCKLPFLAACKKHVVCTERCLQAAPGEAMFDCQEKCQKTTATGCDHEFLARAALIGCSEYEAR